MTRNIKKIQREIESQMVCAAFIPTECPYCFEKSMIELDDMEDVKDWYVIKCPSCENIFKVYVVGCVQKADLIKQRKDD